MKFSTYTKERYKSNPTKEKELWCGYDDFKIGVLLREQREQSGLTQEEIAKKLKTTKSVISRIENHAEDIRLSTLEKFARSLGKEIRISIV